MNAGARLTAFAGTLAVLFAVGTAAGRALDPAAPAADSSDPAGHAESGDGGAHGAASGSHAPASAADAVRGLATAEAGLRLVVPGPRRSVGRTERLAFQVVDRTGSPIRDFDIAHERRMHLIVVRRDLTGFQHLHPTLGTDGTWTTPLRIEAPGSYRVFADFTRDGRAFTLASDLHASGDARLRDLPAPVTTAGAGPLTVSRPSAAPSPAGREVPLAFGVTAQDGAPAVLQPYLGAGGHLVALREGDLAFLHVHPVDDAAAWRQGRVAFATTFPTAGRYRLFLQVQVDGDVRTAAFTQEVSER